MIVSDKYRFVFMHIPKCAGTYVKSHLNPYNDHPYFYYIQKHPAFGKLDYSHIPLNILDHHFPETYKKVCQYQSFAVVRDPYERFVSSYKEHLSVFHGLNIGAMSKREIIKRLERVIKMLDRNKMDNMLPLELVHFQKQNAFLFNDNRLIVKNVYPIQHVSRLLTEIQRLSVPALSLRNINLHKRINESPPVYKNDIIRWMYISPRPFKGQIMTRLSGPMKNMVRQFFFTSMAEKSKKIFSTNFIRDFISDFYQEDIVLFNELMKK